MGNTNIPKVLTIASAQIDEKKAIGMTSSQSFSRMVRDQPVVYWIGLSEQDTC